MSETCERRDWRVRDPTWRKRDPTWRKSEKFGEKVNFGRFYYYLCHGSRVRLTVAPEMYGLAGSWVQVSGQGTSRCWPGPSLCSGTGNLSDSDTLGSPCNEQHWVTFASHVTVPRTSLTLNRSSFKLQNVSKVSILRLGQRAIAVAASGPVFPRLMTAATVTQTEHATRRRLCSDRDGAWAAASTGRLGLGRDPGGTTLSWGIH